MGINSLWEDLEAKLLTPVGRSGGQTVDTWSTSGVPLKSLGYNGSNQVVPKIYHTYSKI